MIESRGGLGLATKTLQLGAVTIPAATLLTPEDSRDCLADEVQSMKESPVT